MHNGQFLLATSRSAGEVHGLALGHILTQHRRRLTRLKCRPRLIMLRLLMRCGVGKTKGRRCGMGKTKGSGRRLRKAKKRGRWRKTWCALDSRFRLHGSYAFPCVDLAPEGAGSGSCEQNCPEWREQREGGSNMNKTRNFVAV